MANIMSLKNVRNKASRNGFDLSRRTCFTAKVGELLPVWWQYVLPGDSFNIDLKSFTRTQPVNTASFGRLREYYDFFFVPFEQLWNKSPEVITQMLNNRQHATGLQDNASLSGDLPALASIKSFNAYAQALEQSSYTNNIFGLNRANLSAKLMSYLGYGQVGENGKSLYVGDSSTYTYPNVSLYPLLAYQKIYADFFRFTQWEQPNPSTFNVDWMTGDGDTVLYANQFSSFNRSTMFDLRYCNYQKDLFHGILPNAQFGETAAVPISGSGDISLNVDKSQTTRVNVNALPEVASVPYTTSGSIDGVEVTGGYAPRNLSNSQWKSIKLTNNVVSYTEPFDVVTDVTLKGGTVTSSSLSILALRQAEALQRWKEVAQAAEEDYKQQIQAHWNVNVSDLLSGQCRYLGGHSSGININEVVNTNLVNGDTSQPADLAGKGVGSLNGQISFNSQGEYGVIMCIYHALPILDYVNTGTDAKLLHVQGTSFPIPEMDSIGMELLPFYALSNGAISSGSFLGYVPRYIDWKTDYDRCVGGFADDLQNWIIPYSDDSFMNSMYSPIFGSDENPNVDNLQPTYEFTKVNPSVVDPMFAVSVDSTISTDHLLIQSYVQCYVTRNLDVNGLPY